MDKQQNFEKNPLDELFARKLGKLERPPSSDSFARLQQRMQGGQERPRMIIWRNPTLQMAAAACVAVAFLVGWLYTGDKSDSLVTGLEPAVAIQKQQPEKPASDDSKGIAEKKAVDKAPQVAQSTSTPTPERNRSVKPTRLKTNAVEPSASKQLIAGKAASRPKQLELRTTVVVRPAAEVVATTKATPTAPVKPAERVLVVTIEEPEALVAARQTAASVVNDMPVLAASSSKEAKATFWQQVKRLKQDDDVARKEGPTDESGLLSRAYKGIKQRLEKDKQTKQ
jgi:hypothetical protein